MLDFLIEFGKTLIDMTVKVVTTVAEVTDTAVREVLTDDLYKYLKQQIFKVKDKIEAAINSEFYQKNHQMINASIIGLALLISFGTVGAVAAVPKAVTYLGLKSAIPAFLVKSATALATTLKVGGFVTAAGFPAFEVGISFKENHQVQEYLDLHKKYEKGKITQQELTNKVAEQLQKIIELSNDNEVLQLQLKDLQEKLKSNNNGAVSSNQNQKKTSKKNKRLTKTNIELTKKNSELIKQVKKKQIQVEDKNQLIKQYEARITTLEMEKSQLKLKLEKTKGKGTAYSKKFKELNQTIKSLKSEIRKLKGNGSANASINLTKHGIFDNNSSSSSSQPFQKQKQSSEINSDDEINLDSFSSSSSDTSGSDSDYSTVF